VLSLAAFGRLAGNPDARALDELQRRRVLLGEEWAGGSRPSIAGGVLLKDLERGLVDFYTRLGRPPHLPVLAALRARGAHWHTLEGGSPAACRSTAASSSKAEQQRVTSGEPAVAAPRSSPRPFAEYAALAPARSTSAPAWPARGSAARRDPRPSLPARTASSSSRTSAATRSSSPSSPRADRGRVHRVLRGAFHGGVGRRAAPAPPDVILPDLKAGARWPTWLRSRTSRGLGPPRRPARGHHRADHLHELDRGAQGLLRARGGVVCTSSKRAHGARVGLEPQAARLLLSRPAPGSQHRPCDGVPLGSMAEWDFRAEDLERANAACFDPALRIVLWRGFCSSTPSSRRARSTSCAPPTRRSGSCAPGVHLRGGGTGRPRGLDRVHHRAVRAPRPARTGRFGTEDQPVHRLALEHPGSTSSRSRRTCAVRDMNRSIPPTSCGRSGTWRGPDLNPVGSSDWCGRGRPGAARIACDSRPTGRAPHLGGAPAPGYRSGPRRFSSAHRRWAGSIRFMVAARAHVLLERLDCCPGCRARAGGTG